LVEIVEINLEFHISIAITELLQGHVQEAPVWIQIVVNSLSLSNLQKITKEDCCATVTLNLEFCIIASTPRVIVSTEKTKELEDKIITHNDS
jgi:hypothetical protein